MNKRKHAEQPPEPKTQRGKNTREKIVAAAQTLAIGTWIADVPFSTLAKAAGVARASLLHAFPDWSNVLYDLLTQELDLLDQSYELALDLKGARAAHRAYTMLVVLIDRAEATGQLYPNLRSEMFSWHGVAKDEDFDEEVLSREVLGTFSEIPLTDHYAAVEHLLKVPGTGTDSSAKVVQLPIGELLINWTLDLAAGSPRWWTTFDERRQALRSTIELVHDGLRKQTARRTRTKRRK